ncbi:MAG: hypothetical protein B6U95_00725 [Thermofilum sp. ex4484_82]|nr:hypothetical protein [Thermoproteales archaeon]OYT30326.1 MAG: hypothetical protein B6U95_00725 [Thermofilum sp. ex4484_82]OYT39931.1 MAG: hypothetical protein B6U96_00735 [Archaeoglobales archaeon ex4484_92]
MKIISAAGIACIFILLFASIVYAQPAESEIIEEIIASFEEIVISGLNRLLTAIINIARAIYILLGIAGVILWATGFNPGRGKQLIIGAIVIAVLLEMLTKM